MSVLFASYISFTFSSFYLCKVFLERLNLDAIFPCCLYTFLQPPPASVVVKYGILNLWRFFLCNCHHMRSVCQQAYSARTVCPRFSSYRRYWSAFMQFVTISQSIPFSLRKSAVPSVATILNPDLPALLRPRAPPACHLCNSDQGSAV